MKTLVFTISLVCGVTALLSAQPPSPAQSTPRPALPAGPLLARAAEFAQWTIMSKTAALPTPTPSPSGSPGADQPAAAATPARKRAPGSADHQISVVKTGTLRFEQIINAGGAKTQIWCVPDMQVTLRGAGMPQVMLPGGVSNGFYTDYSRTDFGGFDWISARNFEGVEKVMGRDCFVFRDKARLDAESSGPGGVVPVAACIDAESRLPVALQLGEETRTYQFGPAPTAMLTLPPDVAAVVDRWRKTLRQAALMPGKP